MNEPSKEGLRKWRKDYQPYPFFIDQVALEFELDPHQTIVRSKLALRRSPLAPSDAPLALDGDQLDTLLLKRDGMELALAELKRDGDGRLLIEGFGAKGTFEAVVRIDPTANRALEGLYRSNGVFCTQCEAEGFRRITWYPDRPDVMAPFEVQITGLKEGTPVLLSNGNRVGEESLPDGRRKVSWRDPFAKPAYLFALVAGDLACHAGSFRTRSGREVALEIWAEHQNQDRCDHALKSLQRAMRWDEERFGLEYDLDLYMIVAVSDFNMGAMENKGLNIFNSKFVLASQKTATDADYEHIEGVIAHEYFHNWTGNRVTCRDWFQLTLKEGLTVYRDQLFTADMTSAAVKRIDDVRTLRIAQFQEDAGPLAHPIRPESYLEMNNFYTATVYEKGAEVVRMYATILGWEGFQRGMKLYFERHDGHAVTCDDFRRAMADANHRDLSQFERWYEQPGTPRLEVKEEWDESTKTLELRFAQSNPKAGEGAAPLPIPLRMALLCDDGEATALGRAGETAQATETVLLIQAAEERHRFTCPEGRPLVSLLRDFSAPVILVRSDSDEDLARRIAIETDPFNRWDAAQELSSRILLQQAADGGEPGELPAAFRAAMQRVLLDPSLDGSSKAQLLALPHERLLVQKLERVEIDRLVFARRALRASLADALRADFERVLEATAPRGPYRMDQAELHRRSLHGLCLGFLARGAGKMPSARIYEFFLRADNMTDRQLALSLLADLGGPEADLALREFYEEHRGDALVIDKWFSVQALATHGQALDRILALSKHADFTLDNPNRVRSLVAAFAMSNLGLFHARDGRGYAFLEDTVLALDSKNPQIAARLCAGFADWRRFAAPNSDLMRGSLERIVARGGLSKDLFEIASGSLQQKA